MVDLPVGAAAKVTSPSSSIFDTCQFDFGAEQAAHKLIQKFQLTGASEERRGKITDYVRRFIRNRLGAEVFPYGSVPLKTYLPDGDIDLTAFGGASSEDKLADEIKYALEEETKNKAAEFVVKDVQTIHAEVKIVKCIVQDIVVDISLNQIGGLSALCFLEQVDRFIGKDHLFKRSIILTKAWCYYESRILGAHHGLIATYALEIMVLYIFHLFYSTLNGPLSVLHKFLDYFSKFDWETYCISLKGPVRLSSLPDVVPEVLEDGCGDLMLTSDFLSSCTKAFSIPSTNSRGFQRKHLNIIDPLKETNNLGRSVNKANFYRIRSAFNYGAQRLDRILLQPEHVIPMELHKFFSDSMARHGCGQRLDVQDFIPPLTCNGSITDLHVSKAELGRVNNTHLATDLDTSGMQGLRISSDSSDTMVPITEKSSCATFKAVCAPHLFFSNSNMCNGSTRSRISDSDHCDDPKEGVSAVKANAILLDGAKPLTFSAHSNNMKWDQGSASRIEKPELLNFSVDLTGDYESNLYGLEYGRRCCEYTLDAPSSLVPPSRSPPLFQIKNPQDDVQSPLHLPTNGFSFRHPSSFHPGSPVYALPHLLLPGVAYGWEEMPKPRGMGTYFPNTNQPPQGYRPSALEGRSQAPPRTLHNNEQNPIFVEPSMLDRSLHEPAPPSESRQPSSPPNSNGLAIEREPEGTVEFGVRHAFGTSIQEISRRQRPVSSSPRSFPATQMPPPGFSKEHDRIAMRSSYSLKDEDDFPPLSV